jgi:hypothetical protein
MPDLEIESVLGWFRLEEPNRTDILGQPVTSAEAHKDVAQALTRLGRVLDEAAHSDLTGLATQLQAGPTRDGLRAVLGQLAFPRTLRLLDWVMQAGLPDSDAILAALMEPDPSGTGQYLQAVLADAARPTLLERIYASDRLAALMAACEPAHGLRLAA